MIIVKMNDAAVECNIAASELQELGLTPEGIGTNDVRSVAFMSELNREIGAQLGFDPKTDILMMSKNLMTDGSLRVFVMKMNNEDLRSAGERVREAAAGILREVTQERIEELVRSEGPDKGRVLNEIMTSVMRELARVITPGGPAELPENPEVVSRPAVEYARYLVHLPDMRTCIRLAKCLTHLPIVDSSLYRDDAGYYLMLGLRTLEDGVVFELRRTCMEFASELLVNAPEELHIEETADCVIGKDAAPTLASL